MSIELDPLDKQAASVFDGYLVRKDLVRNYSRQYPVPTYVVEFLLGRYCASVNKTEIAEGLAARVLLDHAQDADMLVLGRTAHSPDPYRGAGPVIRVCLRSAPCPVVIMRGKHEG